MAINSPLNIAAQPGKTRQNPSAKITEIVAGGNDGSGLSHADDRI